MIDLIKGNFEEGVLKARGYVLVNFYGDGYVPCVALMPHIHKFEKVYGTTVEFCPLNTTKVGWFAITQKALGPPVVAIYKDGEIIDSRIKDDTTLESCEETIKKHAWCPGMAGGSVQMMHNRRYG